MEWWFVWIDVEVTSAGECASCQARRAERSASRTRRLDRRRGRCGVSRRSPRGCGATRRSCCRSSSCTPLSGGTCCWSTSGFDSWNPCCSAAHPLLVPAQLRFTPTAPWFRSAPLRIGSLLALSLWACGLHRRELEEDARMSCGASGGGGERVPGPAHSIQGPQGVPDSTGPLAQLFFICDEK